MVDFLFVRKMSPPDVNLYYFISCLEMTFFFVVDFVYTQGLNRYKREFPELDDCAPRGVPDVDSKETMRFLAEVTERAREGNVDGIFSSSSLGQPTAEEGRDIESRQWIIEMKLVHAAVVVASIVGPLCALLMTLLPHAMVWAAHDRPSWLREICLPIVFALDALFTARTLSLGHLSDVSKTVWLSLMWFRIDFMLIISLVAFIGFGFTVVGLCLFAVSLYLAYRIMELEKRLASLQEETQLLRSEDTDVKIVLVPGSEESKHAVGISEGYSQLA